MDNAVSMTREEVIAYGKKKYGEVWFSKLAKDLSYSVSNMHRLETGEMPEVSRRMELEMKDLMRRERFAYLSSRASDVRY